jgi:hypothetical protein
MHPFRPNDYGPILAPLVSGDRCRALDHGDADPHMRQALRLVTVDAAFAQTPLADREMAACTIAGLWLVHDFLDESHTISQNVDTTTGAYWHALMHRREGDYSNAKYWFRRVGSHSVFRDLSTSVAALAPEATTTELVARLIPGGAFDAFAMVDVCQAALQSGGAAANFCRHVQQIEWELLFDFSYRHAVAA